MAYKSTFTGNGAQTDFAVSFPYVKREYISVTVAGVPVSFSWINSGLVRLLVAPPSGSAIVIRRNTSTSVKAISLVDGQPIPASSYNRLTDQALNAVEEVTGDLAGAGAAISGIPTIYSDILSKSADVAAKSADVTTKSATVTTQYNQVNSWQSQVSADKATTLAAKTSAEAAAVSAAASYDSFDDRYLGAKAVAPTVDNDGNPLLVGALYYDTASSSMKVYSGSVWGAAYISPAGVLVAANNLSDLANPAVARANLGVDNANNLTSGTVPDAQLPARLGITASLMGDWNAITASGQYMSAPSTTSNAPDTTGWWLGTVEVHNVLWQTQTVHLFTLDGAADTKIFRRNMDGGTWLPWYKLQWSQAEQDARYAQLSGAVFAGPVALAGTGYINGTPTIRSASAASNSGVSLRDAVDSPKANVRWNYSTDAAEFAHTTWIATAALNQPASDGIWRIGTAKVLTEANRARAKSSQLTMAASGVLTFAHGLGVQPERWYVYIVCQTAEFGYSVGNAVMISTYDAPSTAQMALHVDNTTVGLTYNGIRLPVKGTAALSSAYITPASWKLVLAAEL